MKRGKRYQEAAKLRDKTNLYDAPEAVASSYQNRL